jgi:hypothetical protein
VVRLIAAESDLSKEDFFNMIVPPNLPIPQHPAMRSFSYGVPTASHLSNFWSKSAGSSS